MGGLGRKSASADHLPVGGMKIRRTNSKSYSSRNLTSFAHPHGDRPRDGHASIASRLRVASFYLTVFISGCLLTGFLLSMSPQQSLERSSSRLMLQHPAAGTVHRRGLYTAGTGGKWYQGMIRGYTEPSRPRIGLVDRSHTACARILAVGALI